MSSACREREVAQEPQGEPGTDFALSKRSGRLNRRCSRSCEELRRLALRPRAMAQIFLAPCIEYNICNITQISRDPYKKYFGYVPCLCARHIAQQSGKTWSMARPLRAAAYLVCSICGELCVAGSGMAAFKGARPSTRERQ